MTRSTINNLQPYDPEPKRTFRSRRRHNNSSALNIHTVVDSHTDISPNKPIVSDIGPSTVFKSDIEFFKLFPLAQITMSELPF